MSDFDDKAKEWDLNRMHLERTKAVCREMLKQIPVTTSMKAMEFGAGTGLLSFCLKESFAEITLFDTSSEMLKIAQTKLAAEDKGKIKTLLFDLEKNEYTGERFDIIFTQMVLHHIKDVPALLAKFCRMLNPGGYLAIADLYTEDGSFHDPGVEVHHGFDPQELCRKLEELGFSQSGSGECFVIRKETGDGTTREYPVFLVIASNTSC
jgi:ubiquinone/menaquinone biosynthesis C-methylase UbiE